jgi:hypothetical protein
MEAYGHIVDVVQGRHTLDEFAEHYCLPPPPIPADLADRPRPLAPGDGNEAAGSKPDRARI